MRRSPLLQRRAAAAALALACLGVITPPVAAVDWCLPRMAASMDQPCPDAKQCCSIWGMCGTGLHYCRPGNCAGGPCLGDPVALPPSRPVVTPDNPFAEAPPSPSPPPSGGSGGSGSSGGGGGSGDNPFDLSPAPGPSPSASPPPSSSSCGAVQQGVDLYGGDLPDGKLSSVETLGQCCGACKATPGCGAFTFVAADQRCFLKETDKFEVRSKDGFQSAVLSSEPDTPSPPPSPQPSPSPSPKPSPSPSTKPSPIPSPPPSPKPSPPPSPKPSPPPSPKPSPPPPSPSPSPPPPSPSPPPPPPLECSATQQDADLKGGDIPDGSVENVTSVGACCDACKARADCGAFTFVPWGRLCYLKSAQGFEPRVSQGMQSGLVLGRPAAGVVVDPAPPTNVTTPVVPLAPNATTGDPYAPGPYKFVDMTADQQRRMYQLTSVFENSNTTLQYGYASRLGDGRGITYGFCGFTTGTDDGIMVVEEFTRRKPDNPLAAYIPALEKVQGQGDSFAGLDGFEAAVAGLANDTDFIAAQWAVCDQEYHQPAMKICQQIQCRHALTKAQLHDALVQHSQGAGDPFSVDSILQAAAKSAGGTPATGVDEATWLRNFLQARYALLEGSDAVARASVDRVRIYQDLLNLGDTGLEGPIYIDLQRRTSTDGKPVWQVKDVHYGEFLIYTNPSPDQKLELIP